MSAAPILELAERSAPEDLTSRLRAMLEWSAAAVAERLHHEAASDAERIDRIALIERLQASLEAAKAVEIVAFARSQAARQVELGTDPRLAERGIAGQIALAARLSPSEGSRRLRSARDLVMDMPQTLDLLATGEVGAWKTRLIVEQFSHLDRRTRTDLDAELARRRPQTMGCRQAAATAKRLAYEADPEAAMARCRKARKDRRVTLRPAPDTMSLLSGLLPVEQGVASLAALQAEATARKANGDQREKEQIMADTLVARITGQDTAEDAGFEVGIVVPLGALIRHLDHIHRHSESGPTTGPNGRGVCERGNYVREMPGWTVRVLDPDSHSVVTTTPTGHSYVSRPPEPP